jgi:hypothetical protein
VDDIVLDGALLLLLLLLLQLDAVLARVDEWQFDAFKLAAAADNRPLSVLAFYLLKRSGLVARVSAEQHIPRGPSAATSSRLTSTAGTDKQQTAKNLLCITPLPLHDCTPQLCLACLI